MLIIDNKFIQVNISQEYQFSRDNEVLIFLATQLTLRFNNTLLGINVTALTSSNSPLVFKYWVGPGKSLLTQLAHGVNK